MMAKQKLYMITTGDRLDLPVAVADSVTILSKMTGMSAGSLESLFSKARNPAKYPTCKAVLKKYHTIIVEEDEDWQEE